MIRIVMLLMVSGFVLLSHPAHGAGKQEEQNKKNVVEFYEKAINQKDFEAASKYMGPSYTQHNPMAANGPGGLKDFIQFLSDIYCSCLRLSPGACCLLPVASECLVRL